MSVSPNSRPRAQWQLPTGVSRGAWDYINEPTIATEYDRFHAHNPLLAIDRWLIQKHLGSEALREDGTPKLAMDLGCGTGRNLIPWLRRGWRTIGTDLSVDMLQEYEKKAAFREDRKRNASAVKCNMVDLSCFADHSVDAILCMFSSLGMVQGTSNRQTVMRNVARLLRADAKFVFHVHNRGSWLRDPGGIQKTVSDWVRAKRDRTWELGDSVYSYRGLPSMFLHLYSERELRRDIAESGLRLESLYRLNRTSSAILKTGFLSHLRSGGFIAVCMRSEPVIQRKP